MESTKGLGKYALLISCTAYVCGAVSFQGAILIMIAALALEWEEEVKINTMQVIVLNTIFYGTEKVTTWASQLYRYLLGFMPYGDLHSLLGKISIFALTNSLIDKLEIIVFIYLAFKAIKGGVVKIPWVTKFVQRALFDKVSLASEVDRADAIITEKARKVKEATMSQAKTIKKDVSKAAKNIKTSQEINRRSRSNRRATEEFGGDTSENRGSSNNTSFDFSSFSNEKDILEDE